MIYKEKFPVCELYILENINESKISLIDKMNSIHNKIQKMNSSKYGIFDKFEKQINKKFKEYFGKNNTEDLNYSDLTDTQLSELIEISSIFLD